MGRWASVEECMSRPTRTYTLHNHKFEAPIDDYEQIFPGLGSWLVRRRIDGYPIRDYVAQEEDG